MSRENADNLRLSQNSAVTIITLDSNSAQNSLNVQLLEELRNILIELVDDDQVRCIAIRGSGEAFCTGVDLTLFNLQESDASSVRRLATLFHDCIDMIYQAKKPVIMGVNGTAAGGGFGLALAGDVCLMSEDAKMEFVYPRIGQAVDGASSYFLPRYTGLRRAMEIALLDEPIEAEQAVELGLVTKTAHPDQFDERLSNLAQRLSSGPTKAYGEIKSLFQQSFEHGLRDQMAAEVITVSKLARTDDWKEGINAFKESEEPNFSGE